VGEKAAACFAEVGDGKSYFARAGRFFWVAGRAYNVSAAKYSSFLPEEVIGTPKGRTVHLFVRRAGEETYLYVGEMGGSFCQYLGRGDGDFGKAHFALREVLPTAVWEAWGQAKRGVGDAAGVDGALARLRGETTVEERLAVLRTVVAYWHGAVGEGDGLSAEEVAGVKMPGVLAWWYRWAGRRQEILCGFNELLLPESLQVEDGKLLFYGENQWTYRWGVDVDGEDPVVYGREDKKYPWEAEGVRLSEHMLMACIFEMVMRAPYGAASGHVGPEVVRKMAEVVPAVAVGPWRWCGTRVYARGGAFMYSMTGDGQHCSVAVGAKRAEEVAFVKAFAGEGRYWMEV
jgi:hypothetical protein